MRLEAGGMEPFSHRFSYLSSVAEKLVTLTLNRAGGGGEDAPPWVFWKDRQTAGRIVLTFCLAYRTSFAKLLVKKWPGRSGHWAMTSKEVQFSTDFFKEISCFRPRTLLPLTGMEILRMIYVSRWPYLTFDIASWSSKGHPRSKTLADSHTYLQWIIWWLCGLLEVMRPSTWGQFFT